MGWIGREKWWPANAFPFATIPCPMWLEDARIIIEWLVILNLVVFELLVSASFPYFHYLLMNFVTSFVSWINFFSCVELVVHFLSPCWYVLSITFSIFSMFNHWGMAIMRHICHHCISPVCVHHLFDCFFFFWIFTNKANK